MGLSPQIPHMSLPGTRFARTCLMKGEDVYNRLFSKPFLFRQDANNYSLSEEEIFLPACLTDRLVSFLSEAKLCLLTTARIIAPFHSGVLAPWYLGGLLRQKNNYPLKA